MSAEAQFPYDDAGTDRGYRLPDGSLGFMRDQVDLLIDGRRAKQEIMLLQKALGVRVDGIIGPETRGAIASAAGAIKRQLEHL